MQHVGISTIDKLGHIETRAATSDLVLELDRLQYSLSEGPCVDSLLGTTTTAVSAPHIRNDKRWPRYVPAAVQLGLKAQLAVRLYLDDLHHALQTRGIIGQAVGLLMAKHNLDPDGAFGFLVRTSSHSNIKVREVAVLMVEEHIAEVHRMKPPSWGNGS